MWNLLLILTVVVTKIVNVEGTTAFNCRNSLITDEWRQFVLDRVNNYRRSLAQGNVHDVTNNFLPAAKYMNELKWDCNLEEIAYKKMGGKCSFVDPFNKLYPAQAGVVTDKCTNITSQMAILLRGWWSEVERVDMKNSTQLLENRAADFGKMALANTTGFACTYDLCKPRGRIICLFQQFFGINAFLYEPTWDKSKACESCADCTNFLCPQKSFTPVTITPTCQDDKLTNDSHNAALWMHNYYRKLLASGWAKDKKSNGGYAKTAKQMRALEYDCANTTNSNGAKSTYDLIKGCPRVNPTATNGYSLNFLRIDNHQISEQDALEQAIKTWWGQLETTGLGSDTKFNGNSGITNFANMAYDQADKVACAVQNCAKYGDTLVACQYNKVITDGEKIYETGKVCGGCTTIGKTCSNPRGL
ncbi:hypothetical protein Y032_0173g395 [Ancylostoma ceylanicum]|uniref:4Fe-4S ferredoxin-type domain-containing protein n=1 Tax=Ancylostoma ceylanicum TaxID=53326 RepID=A0A016SVA6_9BILA|nr:hypothetical protein Y032_0173g395 [Ancylostoma ceylanicum]